MSEIRNADPAEAGSSRKPDAADRLGTDGIGKLLVRFSLPAISGMVVNALYNIVDRIFVGRGVDEVALGGLSLVMPLMTISMAFAMLFGVGSSNMISMRLGQRKREDAENALNHCFWLLVITAIVSMTIQLTFLDKLLGLLGAQEGSRSLDYARRYYRIILYGQGFLMIGFGFSHCTRAQGFPNITMISMFLGAGMNIVLDPIFIFAFGWGVEGAAWATIISQLASAIWIFSFCVSKKAVVKLRLNAFKPSLKIVMQIVSFGSAQFLMQFVMSGVGLINNTSMGWYGASGLGVANGGDIALTGLNIAMSCGMMIMMPMFGINQGAQPILGYNYGAKNFRRVLRAYKLAVGGASAIAMTGCILMQLFPHFFVGIFAPNGSPALLAFAPRVIRTQFIFMGFMGFQALSTNMFIVTGRPKISIFLSLLRQCLALIPCMLIFGRIWGLYGVIAAAPVADGFSLILISILMFFEIRKLRAGAKEQELRSPPEALKPVSAAAN